MVVSKLPNWAGQTVLVLASGPSLREFIRTGPGLPSDLKVVAVNSSIFAAPAADVCLATDFMWWKMHHREVRRDSKAEPWTTDRSAAERYGLNFVRSANESGLGESRVFTNGNSGAAAINFATLAGAKTVLLLGFDMKAGPNGEKHWHPDHPKPCVQSQCFDDWLHRFAAIATAAERQGVEVINCTPDSALTCFPRMPLEDALCPVQ
jgi:hypothetical protein